MKRIPDATTRPRATSRILAKLALATLPILAGNARAQEPPDAEPEPENLAVLILRSEDRPLRGADIRKAVKAALGVELPTKPAKDATEYAMVEERTGIISAKGHFASILAIPKPVFKDPDEVADEIGELRLAEAVRKHRAHLRVTFLSSPPKGKARKKALADLAKLTAELLDDNSLAVSFSVGQEFYVVDANTGDNLRKPNPLRAMAEGAAHPQVTAAPTEELEAAARTARKRWGEFAKHFAASPDDCFVKTAITEGEHSEHLWIEVTKIDGETVHGRVGNEPVKLKKVRFGSKVQCTTEQVDDWMYRANGKLHGGFSLEVLERARRRAREEAGKKAGEEAKEEQKKKGTPNAEKEPEDPPKKKGDPGPAEKKRKK